jgi:hypothetical protein
MVYRNSIGEDFKRGNDAEDRLKRRNEWFLALVRESQIAGDAWIISSPGSETVLVEALPMSRFPADLRSRGYPLREIAGGSRILPHAFHQPMEQAADGTLIAAAEGSTKPVSVMIYGAGPHETRRFEFPAPFRIGTRSPR